MKVTMASGFTNWLCRLGLVILVGLCWINSGTMSVAQAHAACFDENTFCEPEYGENCNNCPQDCDCECGDDLCSPGEPYLETCSSCPEDCSSSCICGDLVCDAPAEGGGPNSDPCDEGDGDCSYCPSDCGACQFSDCDPQTCDQVTGRCRDCGIDSDCPDGYFCAVTGQCEEGDACLGDFECNPGYFCNSNGVCRPVI